MVPKIPKIQLALFLLVVTCTESLRTTQPWVEHPNILRTRSGLDRGQERRSLAAPPRSHSVQALMPTPRAASEAALAGAPNIMWARAACKITEDLESGGEQGGGIATKERHRLETRGPLRESELQDKSWELTRSLSSEMHSPAASPQRGRPPMVFLSRHGQSQANELNMIGMDMGLSSEGEKYAERLGQWVQGNLGLDGDDIIIIRSDMVRTTQTVDGAVQGLRGGHRLEVRSQLNEIHAGAIEGWTFTEFRQQAGQEYQARKSDKLRYRYPGGESYLDLLHRVDPVVKEIQQYGREGKDVLVVAHQATLRCVVARLTGLTDSDANSVPRIKIPLHTIVHVQREEQKDDDGEDGLRAAKGKYTVIGNVSLFE